MKRLQKLVEDKKIIVIGITGGVGCGKSTVLDYMKSKYAASVYIADNIGHMAMQPDTNGYKKIIECFGNDIITNDGNIDRGKLGNIVFNDNSLLKKLNDIIHPEVEKYIINGILEEYNKDGHKLYIIEAALLIEAGYKEICTEIWYIHTDKTTRIKRLKETRGYSQEKSMSIIKNQLSDEEFKSGCDFIIDNGNDFNITKNQIENHMNFCYNYSID